MWCRRSRDTPGYDKSPSVLPPWGFFHKSTVLIIPQKAGHSGTSFAPKGSFRACKCKHSVNFTSGKMVPTRFCCPQPNRCRDVLAAPTNHQPLTNCKQPPFCWLRQYGMHHPGAATAMVPKSLKFLTRPLIFRAGGGKPFKKIDT